MKESEAKTKLCPMMLTNDRDTGYSLCEGSACMAFRWEMIPSEPTPEPPERIVALGPDRPPWPISSPVPSDLYGYCGLAGKL